MPYTTDGSREYHKPPPTDMRPLPVYRLVDNEVAMSERCAASPVPESVATCRAVLTAEPRAVCPHRPLQPGQIQHFRFLVQRAGADLEIELKKIFGGAPRLPAPAAPPCSIPAFALR